ncbi:hypothetical protein TWF225_003369 [Orbilia oligospora]|nr:hypothetical protein TWF225_003369 [Orbilia oligospora]KAF3240260.1 hypothetical protein TWF217_000849 [Orbilia oligospora]KAF3258540.1 hypothetical protein TWF128_004765 [Orbilia oligospora]
MAHSPSSNEFEGSIDFLGRPLMSRTSSSIDFYNSMHIPNNFYSPAPTTYSTDECITPENCLSECDLESSYQTSFRSGSAPKSHFPHPDNRNVIARLGLDRLGPTSAYTGSEDHSPSRSNVDAPPTPASSTEGQACRDNPAPFNHIQQASIDGIIPIYSDKEKSKLEPTTKSSKKKRKPSTAPKAEKPKVPKLDRPLSELTKNFEGLPIRDMERWVHRSVEERRREVEKRDGHVARPMNSFMLYRSAFAERTKQWCLQNNHQVVSSVSGASWPLEPTWIREKYNELARIERINHQAAHPGYKFSPSKNQLPPPRRRKTPSDGEDEEEKYLSEVEVYQDREPELIQIPQLMARKKKQRPKPTDTKRTNHLLDDVVMIDSPTFIQRGEAMEMNILRLQTGAQKSSYETVNPGRPAPVSMTNSDIDGTYYQMSVRPMASTNPGSSVIEDVTIRRTAAPTTAVGILHRELEEAWKSETGGFHYQNHQNQQQRHQCLPQEPPVPAKQEPSTVEQDFSICSHDAPPEVDFEQYRKLLEQQVMQNVAAQQAYLLDRGELIAPYQFVSPGLLYINTSGGCEFGDKGVAGIIGYGDAGGSLWHGMGGGSILHTDPTNCFQYDEWLAE